MRKVDSITPRNFEDPIAQLVDDYEPPKPRPRKHFQHNFTTAKALLVGFLIALSLSVGVLADDVYNISTLYRLLGDGRFLILLQNNAELRPTGGFLGSFAVVQTENGRIKSYRVEGNIYRADNEFIKTHKIPSPKPFQKIWPSSFMAFNGSNWSPDFSTASKEINWYYEQEYQDKVDGVVAINSTAVARLLQLTGPINLEAHNLTFDQENFLSELQRYVEKDYYDSIENQNVNQPKSIIGDLLTQVLERLPEANLIKLSGLVGEFLTNHDVQLNFSDQEKQAKVEQLNWSSEVPSWEGDYIYINNANLGGGKGSLGIEQSLSYETTIMGDESQDSLLEITRTNHGRQDYPVSDNLNYTRVLVPLGSSLSYATLDGQDFSQEVEVSSELEKTVFGFWFDTAISQRKVIKLAYTLPPRKISKLMIDFQPGSNPEQMIIKLDGRLVSQGKLQRRQILDMLR